MVTFANNLVFLFPGDRAKFCMDRKTLPCLQNASQHVPVYLQQFPSYWNHNCKQEAQLSQRGRAMPRVVEYFGQSLKASLSRRINGDFRKSMLRPSTKFVSSQAFAFGIYGAFSVSAVYLQQFSNYSNDNCKKLSILRTPAFIFCLP